MLATTFYPRHNLISWTQYNPKRNQVENANSPTDIPAVTHPAARLSKDNVPALLPFGKKPSPFSLKSKAH